ncbi:cryptochrome/photolyase family protein [Bosea sp. PAMC 26642]|uniref:cryptochrome/photolyase family protein n=1 Tax=Bosea sp. (strain PAMC 26642) TaxID=1792307 RepID=UPI00076FECAA|nr:deoxyribodipyrimidine photo-lyase [Bosea sp. PAMC 26642]AMJ60199.1 deoxyribodipyrimidine photolyase [Bosea sp. PAMC 26642]
MTKASLCWFRDDLRLTDNPALASAVAHGRVLCLYVIDESDERRARGGASCWWLAQSLAALQADITAKGGKLLVVRGDPAELVPHIAAETGVDHIAWNRRYEGAAIALDKTLKEKLTGKGLRVESHNANLLNEPWDVTTKAGTPVKVFSPYWRAARLRGEPTAPRPAPKRIEALELPALLEAMMIDIEALGLEPTKPDWAGGLRAEWTPGEAGATSRLTTFLEGALGGYAEGRNRPDYLSTSKLSPHLRFGEIGPRQIWHATQLARESGQAAGQPADAEKFLTELGWREFSYHLLFHNPDLAKVNFNSRFDAFPWRDDDHALQAWQRGRTGYPMVDAGLRELWTTGWMHNRVRMIVASFLIKHLLIDWRRGEDWFWDTLVDADPANNAASWQWVAGSGADAAPYYRIFNPVSQGVKFDPDGVYVRRWVPEIAGLDDDTVHQPWLANAAQLDKTGITLGNTYPRPIVPLELGRERALAALATLKPA